MGAASEGAVLPSDTVLGRRRAMRRNTRNPMPVSISAMPMTMAKVATLSAK